MPQRSTVTTDSPGLSQQDLHHLVTNRETATDLELLAHLLHPTDSVYFDPLLGELRGQALIRGHIERSVSPFGGHLREPLGPPLFDGETSVHEWQRLGNHADGTTVTIRGTSVRRFANGWLVYLAEYFDTAPLA